MKEYLVRIPDGEEEMLVTVMEKLGAEVEPVKKSVGKKKKKSDSGKAKSKKVSPTYLFGAWKDLDIDPVKIRKEAWDRSHKF